MKCVNARMLLQCQIPSLAAIFFLLCHSGPCHSKSNRRRTNVRKQYKEYKGMLKASNMTSFPEGDIRNLIIGGHEWVRSKERKSSTQPETARVFQSHTASASMATVSRRHRKKGGRKGQKNRQKTSKTELKVKASNNLWRKKLFAMRRQETEELLRAESNELETETTNIQSSKQNHRGSGRKGRRKDRKNHRRQQTANRPIKGQTALSLDIARLKQRCKTRPVKQEIKVDGCLSKSIMNNLCYGQCNSFYIPEIRGKGNGPPSFVSCGFCRPKTVRPIYVTLRCTNRRGHTRWKRRKVSFVKKCRCMEQEINLDPL